jgi:membrane fusion protein, heavy metal efflux system
MKNSIYYILIIFIIYFLGCKNAEKTEITPENTAIVPAEIAESNLITFTDAQLKNANLTIGKPDIRTLKGALRVNGRIDVPPQNLVSVSFPLGGYLKSTDLLPGMLVKKGQNIAILEDQSYIQLQQDYLVAQAKLEFLSKEIIRQKEMNEAKIGTERALHQIQSDYHIQQITAKALAEKLRLIGLSPENLNENTLSRTISVHSPINGYVSKVNVHIGKYLAPTDAMFELVNTSDIHAALTVFEKDIAKLKIGQKVTVAVPTVPEKTYPADIILIGRNLDENRAVEVHCHFEKYEPHLLPGMFLNADIAVTEANALTVPNDAIVRFENKQYVFLAKDDHHFEMVEVTIGIIEKDFSQISLIGSAEKQPNIVIHNAYTVLAKMKNVADE